MPDFKSRKHRLELPSIPHKIDAATRQAMEKRDKLVMDQFNRLADDLYNFKKSTYEAAILPLKGVAMIELDVSEFGVSATWENPQQDEITPTHVRVRIEEITPNDWAEYSYPINSWSFFGLLPNTQYTLQVQLVARFETTDTFVSTTRNCPSVQVLRTAESPIKAKVFTTDPGVGPPVDAGVDTTTVDFTFPEPPDAGAVDSSGCWWEYQFQTFVVGVPDLTTSAWTDIGSAAEVAGDIGAVEIDLDAAPFTSYLYGVFRMKYREVCDGVAGAWVYGDMFTKMTLNVDCGDLVPSDSAALLPYSDANWFDITPCAEPGEWMQQEDSLSGNNYIKQAPGYRGYARASGEWTVYAQDTRQPEISDRVHVPLLSNSMAQIATIHSTSDFSFAIDVYMPELTETYAIIPRTLLNIGNKIYLNIIHRRTAFDAVVSVPRDGGGAYLLRGNGMLPETWNSILYSHDASDPAGRVLYINGVEVDRSAEAIDLDLDGMDTTFQLNTYALQAVRKVYGWKRAVSVNEVVEAPTGEYYYIDGATSQSVDLNVGDVVLCVGVVRTTTVGVPVPAALGANTTWDTLFPQQEYTFPGGAIGSRFVTQGFINEITANETSVSLPTPISPNASPRIYVIYRNLIPTGDTWEDHVQYNVGAFSSALNHDNLITTSDAPAGAERLFFVVGGSGAGLLGTTFNNGETVRASGDDTAVTYDVTMKVATSFDIDADLDMDWATLSVGAWAGCVDVRTTPLDPFVPPIEWVADLGIKEETAATSLVIPVSGAASLATGDLIVIGVMGRSTITGPAGFTRVAQGSVYYSVSPFTQYGEIWIARQGTDVTLTAGGTVTFTQSVSQRFFGTITQFRSASGDFDMTPITAEDDFIQADTPTLVFHPTKAIATHPRGIAFTFDTCIFGPDTTPPTGWTTVSTLAASNRIGAFYKKVRANSITSQNATHGGTTAHWATTATAVFTGA